MENKDYCTLTDAELYSKAETIIDELIKTGGKSFIMMVPARPNEDTDLILAELHQRFLKYWHEHAALQARCDRYEKALKEIKEGNCDFEKVNLRLLRSTECKRCKADQTLIDQMVVDNQVLSGEGEKPICDCTPAFKAAHGECYKCPGKNQKEDKQ